MKGYEEVPERWLNWPAQLYLTVEPVHQHYREFLLIGNMDNDVVQLPVSFPDRLGKFRELFKMEFATLEDYRKALKAAKSKHHPDHARVENWANSCKEALNIRTGQFGHMRSLVCVSDKTWELLVRIIKRENEAVGKGGKSKKKHIGSAADLFPFMGIPGEKLDDVLESILRGDMKLREGTQIAKEFKSVTSLQRNFERTINELYGQPSKNKAKFEAADTWITWEKVKKRVPAVESQSVAYRQYFLGKQTMKPLEKRQFSHWVETVKASYARNPWSKKTGGNNAFKAPVVPPVFKSMLTAAQRSRIGKEDVKFETVLSEDEKHGVLLINDVTENLSNYLELKSGNFGTTSHFFIFSDCCLFKLCVLMKSDIYICQTLCLRVFFGACF